MRATSTPLLRALTSKDPELWADLRGERETVDLSGLELSEANLRNFDLSGADLSKADLCEADLTGADIDHASFEGADLTDATLLELEAEGVNFDGAALDGARVLGTFTRCDFNNTTWESAVVHGSRFVQCHFDGAEFDDPGVFESNRFERCSFRDARGVPDSARNALPEFLSAPLVRPEEEHFLVRSLELRFASEDKLRGALVELAAEAACETGLVATFRADGILYAGLRPELDQDLLEEWLEFTLGPRGRLDARALVLDPAREEFLRDIVVPLFVEARGSLHLEFRVPVAERPGQTHRRWAVTDLVVRKGVLADPVERIED